MPFRDPQVNLYVTDADVAAAFYRDLLGFTESFRTPPDGPADHIELRLGGLVLGVATIEAARAMHGIDVGGDRPKGEVVLWTDDVDEETSTLAASGVPVLSEPHDFLDGRLRSAWVSDPDGNPVQLVSRPGVGESAG